MKKITIKKAFIFFAFIFMGSITLAQIQPAGEWSEIGDVTISKVITDGDNGDGAADGALFFDGTSATVGQGGLFTFDGTMQEGKVYAINSNIFNTNASAVSVRVTLHNKTDNTELAVDVDAGTSMNNGDVHTSTFSYTAVASDAGDVLELRFTRNDDGNTARNFNVDNASLNGATLGARTIVYSEDFRFANFGRGFVAGLISDGGHTSPGNILNRVSNVPDLADSNNLFDPTVDREANRIPNGAARAQRSISTRGDNGSTNFAVDAYAVFTTLDLTSANALINPSDDFVYASFWTQRRFAQGDIATITARVSTDYSGNASTATWTTLPLHSGKFGNSTNDDQTFVKGMVDLSAYTGSTTVTLAIRYLGADNTTEPYSGSNRNGTLYISDLQFITQETPIKNVWDGSTDSDLTQPANWDTKAAPVTTTNNLVIPGGLTNYPTAATALTVNSLTLESGSSFMTSSTVTGTVTSKRNLGVADKWYLVSSPVGGENMTDMRNNNSFADSGTEVSFAPYDNAQANAIDRWSYFANTATNSLVDGAGYSTKLTAAGDISFSGTLNTTDFTTLNLADNSGGSGNAFNLKGNPYASYLSLSALLTANDSGGNDLLTESTIWIWDQEDNEYDTYNSGDSFQIAPNQGFFVKADGASATFSITKAMLSHQTTNTFQKTAGKSEIQLFVNDGRSTKKTKIYYLNGTSTGFDNGYDSSVFSGVVNSFEISTELVYNNQGKRLAIQSLPNKDLENMVIPIGVKAAAGKEIVFSTNTLNLPEGIKVFLEDRLINTFTRLDEANSEYKILLSEALNGIGRFYIHTKTSSVLNVDSNLLESISVYAFKNTLKIAGLQKGEASVKIFNILGKQILNTSFNSNGVKEIALPRLAKGVYIVQLTTDAGKLNKKIILE